MNDREALDEPRFDGRYEILGLAGQGGSSSVRRARDCELDRIVAIKMLLSSRAGAPHALTRLQREALLLSKLHHPHIARVYSFAINEQDGQPYLVMEYLEGTTLSQRIADSGALPLDVWQVIVRQLCAAISYAHEQNVIHRDITPFNILLLDTDTPPFVKVLDFGLAKPVAPGVSAVTTSSNPNTGTPIYASPEQYQGKHTDHRTDIYSLACVFYEMVAGKPPYVGGTVFETMMQKLEQTAPLIPALAQYPDLESALLKGLSPRVGDRFDSVAAFLEAIEAALQKPAILRAVPRRADSSRLNWLKRNALAVAGVALLPALAALLLLWNHDHLNSQIDPQDEFPSWQAARSAAMAMGRQALSKPPLVKDDFVKADKLYMSALVLADGETHAIPLHSLSTQDAQRLLNRLDARLDIVYFMLQRDNLLEFNSFIPAKAYLQECREIIGKFDEGTFPLPLELTKRKWLVEDAYCCVWALRHDIEPALAAAKESLDLREKYGTKVDVIAGKQRLIEFKILQMQPGTAVKLVKENFTALSALKPVDAHASSWAHHLLLWVWLTQPQVKQQKDVAISIDRACNRWLPANAKTSRAVRQEILHILMDYGLPERERLADLWNLPVPAKRLYIAYDLYKTLPQDLE